MSVTGNQPTKVGQRVLVVDVEGVVYSGRTSLMDPYKARFAQDTPLRTLAEATGARVIRSQATSLRSREFVTSAVFSGI